jgi:hypothetical protein
LAAQELDEAARAGAAICAEQAHAEKKDQELESFGILDRPEGRLGRVLLGVGEKGGKRIVKLSGNEPRGRLLVDDAGNKSLVSFCEAADGRENIGISGGRLRGAEFGDREGDGGQKLAVSVDGILLDACVEERSIGGKGAWMLVFVAVGREEIGAVRRTVDGDFTFCAAADGADFFGFGRTEACGFAFLADWTSHEDSSEAKVRFSYAGLELSGPVRKWGSAPARIKKSIFLLRDNRISRGDDLVVEAAGGDHEEEGAHGEQS